MINIENLSKEYRTSRKNKVEALKNINIQFGETGFVCIVGKSGCGKTTFLNCIGTLDDPTQGKVYFKEAAEDGLSPHEPELSEGTELCLTDLSGASLDKFRNEKLGIIYQDYNLINEWTVEDNLKIVFDIQSWERKNKEDTEKRIKEALEFVELEDVRQRYIKELSGGQQQRVAIARAIIKNPKILLADEPTGNLDSANSRLIMKLLKKCSETCLVITVTHDTEMASEFADRILSMQDGCIIKDMSNTSKEISEENSGKNSKEVSEENSGKVSKEVPKEITGKNSEELSKANSGKISKEISEENSKETSEDEGGEDTLTAFPKRKNINTKKMSFSTVRHLAFHSLRIKKLKMFFTLLVMLIVICVAKICITLRCDDVGKAASDYLEKNDTKFLYTYEKCTYSDRSGIEAKTEVRNRTKLKELLTDGFGAENLYPVIENAELVYGENALECKLVVSGVAPEDFELIGSLPEQKDEIVITDYLLYTLGLPEDCLGTTITCNGLAMKISGIVNVGVREYMNTEEYSYWLDLGPLYTDGIRLIVSEAYPEYLAEQDRINIPLAGLSPNISVEEDMKSIIPLSSVSRTEAAGCEIVSGRLPQNDSEVAVSAIYADYCLFVSDVSEIEDGLFGFMDIYHEEQNDAFDGYFSFYEIIPDVKIVGIVDGDTADIILTDKVYDDAVRQYTQNYFADSYEVVLVDKTRRDSAVYTKLYEEGILMDMQDMEEIYYRKEILEEEYWVFELGICITGILLVLLLILFFSFNVKDNHMKIGILKSLGVTNADITRIWVTEALFATGLTWLLSLIINLVLFGRYNQNFKAHYGYISNLIHHNLWTEGLELVVLAAVTVLMVIMPIWVMTDKKPIELIRRRG